MKDKIIFGIISSLPPAIFFVLVYLGAIQSGFYGLEYYFGAFLVGVILSPAITIGGIIHIIREKNKGQKIGYYVLFTVIAALPFFSLLQFILSAGHT